MRKTHYLHINSFAKLHEKAVVIVILMIYLSHHNFHLLVSFKS